MEKEQESGVITEEVSTKEASSLREGINPHAEFNELEKWAASAEAMELSEDAVEREIERRGREAMRQVLQAHVDRRGVGGVGEVIEVEHEKGTMEQKKERIDSRQVGSIFGTVIIDRAAYTHRGEKTLRPLDERMNLPERSYSYELQYRVIQEVVRGPFEECVRSIEQWTGHRLSKRSAEEMTVDASKSFDAFYDQRKAPAELNEIKTIVVGQVDGKGIPMIKKEKDPKYTIRRKKGEKANKKKMATVATVYMQSLRERTPEQVVTSLFDEGTETEKLVKEKVTGKRVWASLEKDKESIIREMVDEMDTRNSDGTKQEVVVTDGERALQRRVKKVKPGVVLILDFLHVLERLWTIAHGLYGEGTFESLLWVREHALMVLQGKVTQVVKGTRQSVTKRKVRGNKKEVILHAAKYLHNNCHYMKYNTYLASGYPIASGAVEGACKNLVKDRMERSGMRWSMAGAEAMLKLRAVKLSGDMDNYWAFHLTQERTRLYTISWKKAS